MPIAVKAPNKIVFNEINPDTGEPGQVVLIDLTEDTITPETVLEGYRGHGADGKPLKGAYKPPNSPVLEEKTITANGTYTPGEGVDGFRKVTVNVSGVVGGITANYFNFSGNDVYVLDREGSHRIESGDSITSTINDGDLVIVRFYNNQAVSPNQDFDMLEFDDTVCVFRATGLSPMLMIS